MTLDDLLTFPPGEDAPEEIQRAAVRWRRLTQQTPAEPIVDLVDPDGVEGLDELRSTLIGTEAILVDRLARIAVALELARGGGHEPRLELWRQEKSLLESQKARLQKRFDDAASTLLDQMSGHLESMICLAAAAPPTGPVFAEAARRFLKSGEARRDLTRRSCFLLRMMLAALRPSEQPGNVIQWLRDIAIVDPNTSNMTRWEFRPLRVPSGLWVITPTAESEFMDGWMPDGSNPIEAQSALRDLTERAVAIGCNKRGDTVVFASPDSPDLFLLVRGIERRKLISVTAAPFTRAPFGQEPDVVAFGDDSTQILEGDGRVILAQLAKKARAASTASAGFFYVVADAFARNTIRTNQPLRALVFLINILADAPKDTIEAWLKRVRLVDRGAAHPCLWVVPTMAAPDTRWAITNRAVDDYRRGWCPYFSEQEARLALCEFAASSELVAEGRRGERDAGRLIFASIFDPSLLLLVCRGDCNERLIIAVLPIPNTIPPHFVTERERTGGAS